MLRSFAANQISSTPPMYTKGLIQRWFAAALALEAAALFLGFDPPLACGPAWPGWAPGDGRNGGLTDQREEPLAGILAVALLGAMALRSDDDNALAREPS